MTQSEYNSKINAKNRQISSAEAEKNNLTDKKERLEKARTEIQNNFYSILNLFDVRRKTCNGIEAFWTGEQLRKYIESSEDLYSSGELKYINDLDYLLYDVIDVKLSELKNGISYAKSNISKLKSELSQIKKSKPKKK